MDALLGCGLKAGSMVMDDSVLVMVAAAKECGDVANDLSAVPTGFLAVCN